MFKALFDLNILWKSKYHGNIEVEHSIYATVIKQWLAQRYLTMNQYEKLLFWLFKKNNKIAGEMNERKIGSSAIAELKQGKVNEKWDMVRLYSAK